ncbi:MAG: hypothetical protein SGPRY_014632, partial [Prymnesium sp.]
MLQSRGELSRLRDVTQISTLTSQLSENEAHEHVRDSIHPVMRAALTQWLQETKEEAQLFTSAALHIEFKLRRAVQATAGLAVPNDFRTAVVCDCLDHLSSQLGGYSSIMQILRHELLQAGERPSLPYRCSCPAALSTTPRPPSLPACLLCLV